MTDTLLAIRAAEAHCGLCGQHFERRDCLQILDGHIRERHPAWLAGIGASRGEPSQAQLIAARLAWPHDLPMADDRQLRAIIRAANYAPWPDPAMDAE